MTAHTDALRRRAASELDGLPLQQQRRPRVKSWIIFSMAVVVAFFGLILSRISLDKSAFDLEDLEQRIETEQARQGELRVEVARLQAPQRISGLAEEMGLVYPAQLIALVPADTGPAESSIENRWAQMRSRQIAHP
jgi:cell division protein FtsL